MVLASDLIDLYGEDVGSNMDSDTEVNESDFFTIQATKMRIKRFLLLINFHFD